MPLWSRPSAPPWEELRERVIAVLAAAGAQEVSVAPAGAIPVVVWTDGPGPATVRHALGDPPGWTLVDGPVAPDVSPGESTLHLDRHLGDLAAAVCLVRFYASQGRHWSSSEGPAYQAAWRDLTAADDPDRSGFPIVDVVAALLLDAPDPPLQAVAGPTRADELSAKLAAIGYERLWAIGFASVS